VSTAYPAAVRGPSAFAARSAGRLAGAAGLLLFAIATGVALSKHPLPLTLVLTFGVGLLGTLALALARYDAAVGLGIFLLAAVRIEPAPQLVGLSSSRTGPVHCDGVTVPRKWLLGGPVHEVMRQGLGAKTGGLQTSALAIGLAGAAIDFVQEQSAQRCDNAVAGPPARPVAISHPRRRRSRCRPYCNLVPGDDRTQKRVGSCPYTFSGRQSGWNDCRAGVTTRGSVTIIQIQHGSRG